MGGRYEHDIDTNNRRRQQPQQQQQQSTRTVDNTFLLNTFVSVNRCVCVYLCVCVFGGMELCYKRHQEWFVCVCVIEAHSLTPDIFSYIYMYRLDAAGSVYIS